MKIPTNQELDAEIKRLDNEIDLEVERITADVYRRVMQSLDNLVPNIKALNQIKNQIEREWENDRT
jgi:hypothetical protein